MSDDRENRTLEKQIGQLLVVGFYGTTIPPTLHDLIVRYHIGNIILFSRNLQHPQQIFMLTRELQTLAKNTGQRSPLFIMLDQENGMVRRLESTIFPGNMALGAVGSEQIAYDIAQATGHELKALGINMNLAPVVDVNNNPANPIIGTRSFGSVPSQVARLAIATMHGYQEAGLVSTLKHFPGHGDTSVDSHQALPTIPHTLERLEQVELLPFRKCIQANADSIMIAHIYLPHLMSHQALPATVSPTIIQGLLRRQLGFDGVVVSDCMEMKAITQTVGTEQGAVMALQAGTDLVLVSHHYKQQQASVVAIQTAVRAGYLSEATIQQATERVLRLKERYLSWDTALPTTIPTFTTNEEHRQLQMRAYALSTTLVRDDAHLLPLHLQPDQNILLLYPQQAIINAAQDRTSAFTTLVENILQRHSNTHPFAFPARMTPKAHRKILHIAQKATVTIMITLNAHLEQQQTTLMHQLLQAHYPIIGVAMHSPYDLLSFPQLRTYITTYEYNPPAQEAVVRALFGEIEPQGQLPINLF